MRGGKPVRGDPGEAATRFVSRQEQLSRLLNFWEQAKRDAGQSRVESASGSLAALLDSSM
jgi:hypothetical protein